MKYEIEEIRESVDLLIMNRDEFDKFNNIFITAILKHYPYIKEGDISPLNKMILTDGFHRVEFKVRRERPTDNK